MKLKTFYTIRAVNNVFGFSERSV